MTGIRWSRTGLTSLPAPGSLSSLGIFTVSGRESGWCLSVRTEEISFCWDEFASADRARSFADSVVIVYSLHDRVVGAPVGDQIDKNKLKFFKDMKQGMLDAAAG